MIVDSLVSLAIAISLLLASCSTTPEAQEPRPMCMGSMTMERCGPVK